jgi:RNA polymerase sigma-70 factor, ECF subfamily
MPMIDESQIKQLILATAARDARAFETLYRLTSSVMLGVAMRITRRRETAEEALHDAFVKIWNQAKSFDPTALKPMAWLNAIVRNRALDMVTSAEATRVDSLHANDDDDDDPLARLLDWGDADLSGEALDEKRAQNHLRDCFATLKPTERQALALAYHHGMSHSELAEHLQKPMGSVKSWVRRGLETLRICMDNCMGLVR